MTRKQDDAGLIAEYRQQPGAAQLCPRSRHYGARTKQPVLALFPASRHHLRVKNIGGHITLILPDPNQRAASFHALGQCGGRVIRSFASAEDYLEAAEDVAGGVVLLHWAQPGKVGGRALLGAIAARGDQEALVVADRLSLAETRAILRSGARDLVPAPIDPESLQQIVVNALFAWSDAQVFRESRCDARHRLDRLTPREHDILTAMAEGLASKEIARRFDLSPRTIEVHRANIMRRSGAHSFAELMRLKFLAEIGLPPRSSAPEPSRDIRFGIDQDRGQDMPVILQ